jgi:hypothetical protein
VVVLVALFLELEMLLVDLIQVLLEAQLLLLLVLVVVVDLILLTVVILEVLVLAALPMVLQDLEERVLLDKVMLEEQPQAQPQHMVQEVEVVLAQ